MRTDVALKRWVRNGEQKRLWECCRSLMGLSGREEPRGLWIHVGFAENGQIVEPQEICAIFANC